MKGPGIEREGSGGHPTCGLALLAVASMAAAAAGCGDPDLAPRRDGARNVVLISIDTCRADHLSVYGYPRETSPHIDAVAREGVTFMQALTPTPITLPAHSSLLTGTNPPTHGVHMNTGYRLSESSVTLAEVMREAGYRTAAFVGAFPLDSRFGLDQGFDSYDDRLPEKAGGIYYNERTAEQVGRAGIAWLEQPREEPFLLFLHYFDPHAPFRPPEPFATDFADQPYAGEIAYVDHWIGRVIQALRDRGLYEETLVVITADHGEGLGQHGEESHSFFIYQSTVRVPLIVRAPGGVANRRVDDVVSVVDVMPTVLGWAGIEVPPEVQGVDLRDRLEGRPDADPKRAVYCESLQPAVYGCSPLHGIVQDGWKYIRSPKPELYRLREDPGEQFNVADREPIANDLRDRLEVMLAEMQAAAVRQEGFNLDVEDGDRLRALGYVGGVVRDPYGFDPEREDPKEFMPILQRVVQAFALCDAGRFGEAEKVAGEIVALRPELYVGYSILGQIALRERRADDAIGHLSTVLTLLSEDRVAARHEASATHHRLGAVWMLKRQWETAAREFEKAVEIDPGLARAHADLGEALVRQGKPAEAVEHYRRAIVADPDDSDARSDLGELFRRQGMPEEAAAEFEAAVRIDPRNARACNGLGIVLGGRGKPAEAVAWFERALEADPELVEARNNLAVALTRLGRFAEAASQHDDLAAAYAGRGRFDDAVSHASKAIELAEDSGDAALAAEIGRRRDRYLARDPAVIE